MARMPLADPTVLDDDARAQYERFPSNLTRSLLLLDRRLARALPETANALRASDLDPAVREAVILRVASVCQSPYERMQHLGQAHTAGWDEEQIAEIETGNLDTLADRRPDVLAALTFADGCLAGMVDDTTFTAARVALGERGLVTTIVLVGHYMMIARLTGILAVELDEQPDSWTHEH